MKFLAPLCSPCTETAACAAHGGALHLRDISRRAGILLMACFALAGCQTTKQIAPRLPPPAPAPTFSCDTTAQEIMCSDEALARLDKELATIYHQQLRHSDSIGRDLLVAGQSRWLIGRASACQVPTLRLDYAAPPNPALVSCLIKAYAERIAALKQWPQSPYAPPVSAKDALASHRLSA